MALTRSDESLQRCLVGDDSIRKQNGPVEISEAWGVEGDGWDARTTLIKCVRTATLGGLPVLSYV